MDNTRTVTDVKQQKIKIKKDVFTSSMSTIVDRTCYVFFLAPSQKRLPITALHEGQYAFLIISRLILLRIRYF
jgi:hypothetical protein